MHCYIFHKYFWLILTNAICLHPHHTDLEGIEDDMLDDDDDDDGMSIESDDSDDDDGDGDDGDVQRMKKRNGKKKRSRVDEGTERDNRSLIGDRTNQKLTEDDILRMKSEGGEQIVKRLVQSSSTFHTKNIFSQEKYLKRKKQKYCRFVKVLQPTAQLMCEFYLNKSPEKIGFMRYDALSQLMVLGNVYPGMQVTVFETLSGLVTASILERMSVPYTGERINRTANNEAKINILPRDEHSHGRIIRMCDPHNTMSNFSTVQMMNLFHPMHRRQDPDRVPDVEHDVIFHCPLFLVNKRSDDDPITGLHVTYDDDATLKKEREDEKDVAKEEKQSEDVASSESATARPPSTPEARRYAMECRMRQQDHATKILYHKFFNTSNQDICLSDSLIIATHEHDVSMLFEKLFPFLSNSGTFAIYSPFRAPLEKLLIQLKQEQPVRCLMVQLTDTWTREYQILPRRSHPLMRTTSESGFILSGTKVSVS